jgi:hypothetical protein
VVPFGMADSVPPARRLVELNHPITAGMTTYPGMPGPVITPYLTREDSRAHYAEGTEFSIGRIEMIANTGTYLDTPSHRYEDGHDLAGLDLAKVADVPATVIDLTGATDRAIGPEALAPHPIGAAAVLLRTGWDRHWGTDAYLATDRAPTSRPKARPSWSRPAPSSSASTASTSTTPIAPRARAPPTRPCSPPTSPSSSTSPASGSSRPPAPASTPSRRASTASAPSPPAPTPSSKADAARHPQPTPRPRREPPR